MSEIWMTGDLHFSHKNIIKFDDRPFESIEEHDEALVDYFNESVKPGDIAFLLGDICMGHIADSLEFAKRLNGHVYLIPGNHDRVSHVNKEEYQLKFRGMYEKVFKILPDNITLALNGVETNFSHFPYDGDHMEKERYSEFRMKDRGVNLIHAHTHSKEKFSLSAKGSKQVNVGVPAWNWRPAHIDQVAELFV